MEALAEARLIHRDLALRNVLVFRYRPSVSLHLPVGVDLSILRSRTLSVDFASRPVSLAFWQHATVLPSVCRFCSYSIAYALPSVMMRRMIYSGCVHMCLYRYVATDYTRTSVKVSDFGLTVNAYTATAHYQADGPKPIRYRSPEALRRGRYSEQSDVWAFGVLTWELLTGGDTPFFDILEENLIRHIVGGGKLPTPMTPDTDTMWAAVQACFGRSPKDRPSFAQLGVTLGQVAVPH